MRLVKGGLAEQAGMKCSLNIVTATRNDYRSLTQAYSTRSLRSLENTKVAKKGKVYK